MAAEFDSSAFSAVDKFFGGGTETAKEEKKVSYNASGSRGKRRGGVGASSQSSDQAKTLSSDLLAKKVLTVGRKRGRDDSNEDDCEGDAFDDHGVHDGDEADGGRTSIAPKKKTVSKTVEEPKVSKPKKKLGKKERQKLAAQAAAASQENQSSTTIAPTEPSKVEEGDDINHNGTTQQKTKKKRRKVRSRQKNIRKDNRSADEKPDYLKLGSRNYQGRPMTEATRAKLNLPAPVKKSFRGNFHNDKGDDSLFVIDRNGDSAGDDMGVKLAIDEFMENDDNNDADNGAPLHNSEDNEPRRKEKKKSSKKKKKRFKNL